MQALSAGGPPLKYELAPFASRAEFSRGRFVTEPEAETRTPFQRDRDRIVHSTAFRRLKHKTQVFVYHEGDHYRTRLTHSLEVSQIARAMSRTLALDEDLTEALSLAHDLGHTPFGHAGERALDACMVHYGGFDHNAQALRIVTRLERRYAAFDGLNLSWETLEGLVKHNGPLVDKDGSPCGTYSGKSLPAAITDFAGVRDLALETFASAEAQIASIADDIAYNAHDIDDGLRAGLFDIIDLGDLPLVGEALSDVLRRYPDLERPRLINETVRRVISAMVDDVTTESLKRVRRLKPESADAVRALDQPLIGLSLQLTENNRVLQSFLSRRMYHHEKIRNIMERAQRVVRELFASYMDDPATLPREWRGDFDKVDEAKRARRICDFIAGMTDRFALDEHRRLFDLDPLFR
ncbi:deoxyguanosinetriphosphate triphosphohydrolase [Rhodoligotrophos appendicifer]|uniref:deoxyguanosinetriphosphate triphosphohydrolase n=1 Tax=Rhodoligotrophos appendicifer TaxID=987056 RepID=UPI0011870347|nr:deoxyguanosinetriphosphate triphosphohydrolase [Rhodoligotrophos appendicifer]